jgi:methyl-accepting chemotaxis protein
VKIGQKLTFGFLALVALTIILGLTAGLGLLNISSQAHVLDEAYLPEVEIASKIERTFRTIIFNVRGYAETGNKVLLNLVKEDFDKLSTQLDEASVLAEEHSELEEMKKDLPEAKRLLRQYKELVYKDGDSTIDETTEYWINAIDNTQLEMESAFGIFIKDMAAYIDTIEVQQTRANNSRAGASVLNLRAEQIQLANDIIDLGNAARSEAYRGQAIRDYSLLEQDELFAEMEGLFKKLEEITANAAFKDLLIEAEEASHTLKEDMEAIQTEVEGLNQVAEDRGPYWRDFLKKAESFALKGIQSSLIAGQASIDTVNGLVLITLITLLVSIAVGILLAILLTRSITKPLGVVSSLAQEVTRGNFEIEIRDVQSKDELGDLEQAFYAMMYSLQAKADVVSSFAQGNLTAEVVLSSEVDGLGKSLQAMKNSLNEILTQVDQAVIQMARGSRSGGHRFPGSEPGGHRTSVQLRRDLRLGQ